jgi:hypothetical protein
VAQENPDEYDNGSASVNVIEGRNNYRMPDYHRLVLGVNFHRKFKRARRTINVSVYNVYNRQNPFIVIRGVDLTTGNTQLQQVSIFPIIPSVSYSYKF